MITVTYLDDGSVRVETSGIPGAAHMQADEFFKELKALGLDVARVATTKRHTHQQVGQRAHQGGQR